MTSPRQSISVHAIVPAAGLSRRMGRPKQTLPYRGSTVLGTVVRTLLEVDLASVVVVTRSALRGKLDLPPDPRISVVINNDGTSQMIDSLRIGLDALLGPVTDTGSDESSAASNSPAGVLVLPGDMPDVTADTCRRCIHVFRRDPTRIVIAAHGARRGHPVIFPASFRRYVDSHREGLNSLLQSFADRTRMVDMADAATLRDFDTWLEYLSGRQGN